MPLEVRKRGMRKVMVSPDGAVLPCVPRYAATNADLALLKALDRTYVGDALRGSYQNS